VAAADSGTDANPVGVDSRAIVAGPEASVAAKWCGEVGLTPGALAKLAGKKASFAWLSCGEVMTASVSFVLQIAHLDWLVECCFMGCRL